MDLGAAVETVSQREMRNRSGELLRRVAAGERVRITTDGVVAADLVPPFPTAVERLRAEGRLSPGSVDDFADFPPAAIVDEPLAAMLDDLRGDA